MDGDLALQLSSPQGSHNIGRRGQRAPQEGDEGVCSFLPLCAELERGSDRGDYGLHIEEGESGGALFTMDFW